MPFCHFAGLDALDVFTMLTFNEDSDDKELGKLLEKFEASKETVLCVASSTTKHDLAKSRNT